MSKTNTKTRTPRATPTTTTYEGAPAYIDTKERELRRAVLACLLFEDNFYESGVDIAKRIQDLASKIEPEKVAALAIEARQMFNLRHVPLLLLCVLAKTGKGIPHLVANTVERVISRADEPGELIALYWKLNGERKVTSLIGTRYPYTPGSAGEKVEYTSKKVPLPAQFKKGLARAILKFDQYQLTKYNRDVDVKLRDVIFMTHPDPSEEHLKGRLFANFVNKDHLPKLTKSGAKIQEWYGEWEKLNPPETWEVELSAGKDKKEVFTKLLMENKLGYLALLRNLRNMEQSGVDPLLVQNAILARKGADRVLPFRFIAAAKYSPVQSNALDVALRASVDNLPKLPGKTGIMVDVSGSMDANLSQKSDMTRMDAAAALASIMPCEYARVFSFSYGVKGPLTNIGGLAGITAIVQSQQHGGTNLGGAVQFLNGQDFDRIVVITDEQSHTRVPAPKAKLSYMINVGGYKNSVATDKDWIRIEGFTENVIRYMSEIERYLD